jgi:hypothetical protein
LKNDDHIDCCSSAVLTRRWRVGIFSLAPILVSAVDFDLARSETTTKVGTEVPTSCLPNE